MTYLIFGHVLKFKSLTSHFHNYIKAKLLIIPRISYNFLQFSEIKKVKQWRSQLQSFPWHWLKKVNTREIISCIKKRLRIASKLIREFSWRGTSSSQSSTAFSWTRPWWSQIRPVWVYGEALRPWLWQKGIRMQFYSA